MMHGQTKIKYKIQVILFPGLEAPCVIGLKYKIQVILFPGHEAPYVIVLKYKICYPIPRV